MCARAKATGVEIEIPSDLRRCFPMSALFLLSIHHRILRRKLDGTYDGS